MVWKSIFKLNDAICGYLGSYGWLHAPDVLPHEEAAAMSTAAERLHRVASRYLDGMHNTPLLACDSAEWTLSDAESHALALSNVITLCDGLLTFTRSYLPAIVDYDPQATEIGVTFSKIRDFLTDDLQEIETLQHDLPGDDDLAAAEVIRKWLAGKLGDITLRDVVIRYVINGLSTEAALDRLHKVARLFLCVDMSDLIMADPPLYLQLNDLYDELSKADGTQPAIGNESLRKSITTDGTVPLPPELEPIRPVFEAMVVEGLMGHDGGKYKWSTRPGLYGLFIDALHDTVPSVRNYHGKREDLPWELFGQAVTNGDKCRNAGAKAVGRLKDSAPPKGSQDIVQVIECCGIKLSGWLKRHGINSRRDLLALMPQER